MEKAKIEITEDELTTILTCVTKKKEAIEVKVEAYQDGLDSGYYAEKFEDGYEDVVKGYIVDHQKELEHLNKLYEGLISRFVKGELENE